ncbi:hypothetical protein Dimus_018139, partial [Dionaea muscipula]
GASDDHIVWLAKGHNPVATKYGDMLSMDIVFTLGCVMRDAETRNSGVTLNALTSGFADSKIEIRSLEMLHITVIKDDYGLTCVNFNKLCYVEDPFVMASQVLTSFLCGRSTWRRMSLCYEEGSDDIFDSLKNDESNANWMEPHEFEFGAFASDIEEELVWTEKIYWN